MFRHQAPQPEVARFPAVDKGAVNWVQSQHKLLFELEIRFK